MYIYRWLSCGLIFLLGVNGCYAAEADAEATLASLLQHYQTYSAQFEQRTVSSQGVPVSTSQGRVMIKKPDYFFWETLTPNHQQLIGVKNHLWVYDVDLAQATERPVSGPGQMNPADILVGKGDALSHYFVIKALPSVAGSHQLQFELTAKDPDATFFVIQLTFKKDRLVQILSDNNLGQTTTFSFSKIVLNQPIPDAQFMFNPNQPGIDILKVSSSPGS